ncbi:MAG: WecB/TagA/CpsF family glycosyltransferase [Negativicutes bacterium]|nr:WecB/TagA/CpsF family glycosyltransferase [Negativicutes bacterium]
MSAAVDMVELFISQRKPRLVATANAEMVMLAQQDDVLADVLLQADLVVPDGAGVVWAARHLGFPVPERVAGYDLAQALMAKSALKGYRVYFFGGAPGVAEKAKEIAKERFPGLCVAGVRNGFFSAGDEQDIIADIRACRTDILFVALGVPKQEKWLAGCLSDLAVPVSMGVGGTFDVMAGVMRRAPVWMQKSGLEWLFRLGCQPQRFIRMLALPRFVLRVLAAKKH